MLLRRTRADQVAEHLPRVLSRFPNPDTMASADERVVETVLRPLGLNWRSRTLRAAAKQLVRKHGGRVPLEMSYLMELPGVGPYVAAATISALSRKKVVLIDTNTVRVARRVAGINLTGDIRRRRVIVEAVESLLGGSAVAADWWAVLDLAAKVCLSGRPLCDQCPIRHYCATGVSRAV
jgi:A/G-specific adenine glycosylase